MYHNDLKFSDRLVCANSADPDQTAPRGAVWSGSLLFATPFLTKYAMVWPLCLNFRRSFLASENLGHLWYVRENQNRKVEKEPADQDVLCFDV